MQDLNDAFPFAFSPLPFQLYFLTILMAIRLWNVICLEYRPPIVHSFLFARRSFWSMRSAFNCYSFTPVNVWKLKGLAMLIFSRTFQRSFSQIGETGLGKSTLMDTLFNTKFEGDPASHSQPGVQLKSSTYDLQESNVNLKLTIVSTVGFGDQINKEDRWVKGKRGCIVTWFSHAGSLLMPSLGQTVL